MKNSRYERLYRQLADLITPEIPLLSRMSTVVAVLHHKMEYYFWTGFYLLNKDQLQVGPYQGSLACIQLKKGRGVCWASIDKRETIIVPDVHLFPGHIACDSRSKSEIVIPLKSANGEITGVLDIDSKELNSFDEIDKEWLEKIVYCLIMQ